MSDFKVGDRVRRTEPCGMHSCEFPPHQVGWEGTVTAVREGYLDADGMPLAKHAVEKVEKDEDPIAEDVEDERIAARETIIKLKRPGTETSEALPLSAAPDPAIRLEVLKLVLSHFSGLTPDKAVDAAADFVTWVEGR